MSFRGLTSLTPSYVQKNLVTHFREFYLFGEFREVSGGDGGVRYSIVAGDIMVEVEEMVEVVVPGEQAPVASSEVV